MDRVMLFFPAQRQFAERLAAAVSARCAEIAWHRFPDGESLIRIDAMVAGADVAIVASLDHPDAIALPLRFAAATARDLGARSVGLVAPYLAYLRQDRRFRDGESLSARNFADFLCEGLDWLVTVDAHLHRAASLAQWYSIPATNVLSAPAVAAWMRTNVPDPLLIGPDAESAQWVSTIAARLGCPWMVMEKHRRGDREVDVVLPVIGDARGRHLVLIDDIISTGRTQEAALQQLAAQGLPAPTCVATHAVFADDAFERLMSAGAGRIVTTDTIPHRSNAIGVASLLAQPVAWMFQAMGSAQGQAPEPQDDWFDEGEPRP